MTVQAPPRRRWVMAAWLTLYAIIGLAEFLLDRAKDFVSERIWPDEEDEDESEAPS